MCGTIIKFLLGIISVLLLSLGICLVSIRSQLLNSQNYKQALGESGIYEKIISESEKFLLPDKDKPETKGFYTLFGPVIENINLNELLPKIVNNNIDNLTNWLNTPDTELFIYFPRQEVVASFKYDELEANVIKAFNEEMAKLPECSKQQEKELNESQNEAFSLPTCLPSKNKQQFIKQKRQQLLDTIHELFGDSNPIEATLSTLGLDSISESTAVSELQKNQSAEQQQNTKNVLNTAKSISLYSAVTGWVMILIGSIIALAIAAFGNSGTKKTIASFASIMLVAGILVSLVGFAGTQLPELLISRISFPQVPADFSDQAAFAYEAAKSILGQILVSVFRPTLILGLGISLASIIVFAISKLSPSGKIEVPEVETPETDQKTEVSKK